VTKKLPVIGWLPKYDSEDFVGDLIAGITVAFTVIPQSIAYAELAHLPTQVSSVQLQDTREY
jgi:sodium-independent sulfate anion transporter 11